MSNSCSVTLLTFHFSEARQHNFVLKIHIHYPELDQFLLKLKRYSSYVKKTSVERTLAQSKALHTGAPPSPKQIQDVHEPGLFQYGYPHTAQKMEFCIKDFFSKCDQIGFCHIY